MNALSDWQELAAVVTVIGAVGGLVLRLLVGRARAGMTPLASHEQLVKRVEVVERGLIGLPSAPEMETLSARVGEVERNVAVVGAKLDGVAGGVGRVERMLDLLVQNELKKEQA